jgi:flagellar motor switch protein FliM
MAREGSAASAVTYDFRRPNKFNREHVRALQIANETFARQFTTVLSTTLRAVSQVSLRSVGQLTYDEYVRDIPNPSFLAVLSLSPLTGASIFHLPLPLVMTAIDRLLGGTGTGSLPQRSLTDIEQSVIRNLFDRVLRELAYAFESLTQLEPSILHLESNPQFAQVAAATDMVVVIHYDIRIGSRSGEATLCIPFSSLQPVLDEVTGNALLGGWASGDPAGVANAVATRLDAAPMPVSVRFDEVTLRSGQIVDLRPGDVLPLHHPVGSPLTVSVNGVPRFSGMSGRRGARLACLIVDPNEESR